MSTTTVDPDPLRPDSIPTVDLRLLSQSDLHSLSSNSSSSSNLHRSHNHTNKNQNDVVIPKIDRSVFNESAASRKQTYSRLRLAPADSSSSNSTTIHRRIRRGPHAPVYNAFNDPEHSHIVRALKGLFQSDHLASDDAENDLRIVVPPPPEPLNPNSPAELLDTESLDTVNPNALNAQAPPEPLDAEAPESLDAEAHESLDAGAHESLDAEAHELVNAEAPEALDAGTKRKRGRPRKNEGGGSVGPPVAKRMRQTTVKKVVVYDDGKDREVVDGRGVEVNLRELGGLEDPYGAEIRRRTEGLSTSDELLGFMRGLEGQWGTTRKKRRVVDASEFGDVLPRGWKLSLAIKKKDGRVWLFCRRYISPSGRLFESCKDISVYLLSILGEENMDKSNDTRNNNFDDYSALKGSSGNDANLYVQEDLKRNSTVHNPSTSLVSLPTDSEKQITYGIVGPVDVHTDDVFKCLKCFLIFERKNDLFDHQSSSHKEEKSQHDSFIPDWSIVVGGMFVCKFCQDTFYEINQYNGHIGTHVTTENKTAEKTVDPDASSAEVDHKMSHIIETKNIDEVVHDLDMNDNIFPETDEAPDVLVEESGDVIGNKIVNDNIFPETEEAPDVSVSVSKSACDLDEDIVSRSNGQDSGSETRVQSSSICEEKGIQANINDAHVCSSFDKLSTEKGKVVCSESSSGFFHGISNGRDSVFETGVHSSRICEEEKGVRENINDAHISSSFDELTSEKGKIVNNESSSGVFHGISDCQDAVSETRVQNLSFCEEKGFRENIDDNRTFSPFHESTSEKGKVVNIDSSSGIFHNRLGLVETKKLPESESLSLFPNKFKIAVDNPNLISSNKQGSFQKLGFGSVDQVAPGYGENRFSYNISSSKIDEQYEARNSEFDRYEEEEKEHVNKGYYHIKNDKSGETNLNESHAFRNNEPINNEVVSLGNSSQNGLNANVLDFNTGKNIEFSSLAPPGNNQAFGFQDGLKFDDIFGDKFDENIHELSLAFGNPNSLYEDTVSVNEQKKDGLSCSPVVSSKINNTYDVQTDLSMVNNSMVQDLKRGTETRRFQNNDNSVYSGRTWGEYKPDEFRNSEDKKFMMGSGSNQMWKTAQGNNLQSGLMNSQGNHLQNGLVNSQGNHLQSGLVNPHAQIQSPNFHSFDIMSQKAQDGLLRQNERYNPSRSEPVEFRFLTDRSELNPHVHQSGSRVFPHVYNPGIEQGFDSTFWMGKNAMMPNMSARNVITSECTWCRNEFQLPAMVIHQQIQAGVGSLCPNCSAGISGQVNML